MFLQKSKNQYEEQLKRHPILLNSLVTIALLLAATGLAMLLFHFVQEDTPGIAMLYLLAQVLIARYTQRYIPGVLAAIFSVFFTNYYFTAPYLSFTVNSAGYPITFLCMLAITISTSAATTHMKQQAAIIAKHNQLLMEADKEKMRANLLRAISHDLRTPLTSIIGSSTSYLENEDRLEASEKRSLVEHIYEDSTWLLHMVENLLSITRIHQDTKARVTRSLEPFEEVLSEAVLRLKKRAPDAQIEVHFPSEFVMIPMDAMLIEQVIINLLENALVHSESIQPIDCFVTTDKTSLTFHVRDYGKGIDPARLPGIFDGMPESQSGSADSHKGAGIGLTICKTIILAHGGTIEAKNHKNGAEFLFTLPREEA